MTLQNEAEHFTIEWCDPAGIASPLTGLDIFGERNPDWVAAFEQAQLDYEASLEAEPEGEDSRVMNLDFDEEEHFFGFEIQDWQLDILRHLALDGFLHATKLA